MGCDDTPNRAHIMILSAHFGVADQKEGIQHMVSKVLWILESISGIIAELGTDSAGTGLSPASLSGGRGLKINKDFYSCELSDYKGFCCGWVVKIQAESEVNSTTIVVIVMES